MNEIMRRMNMPGYKDMHDHLRALEEAGLLIRVSRAINKDTELHPLVRWQFRGGIPEEGRKGFLFENVTDAKGKHYDIPVAVGVLASSRSIYALGIGCEAEDIDKKWKSAYDSPVEPTLVGDAPCQEIVITGKELEEVGLSQFPVPISTPGFDNGPYTTCSLWITKDPETGIRNVGNYRGQIKSNNRVGLYLAPGQHLYAHWEKCRRKGIPLEAALVVGAPPVVCYAGVQKVPFGVDELAVAGALAGEPINLVGCKTVNLEVPAEAEIVIEGIIPTDELEPEGPFGESHGYMHPRMMNPFMNVTAITRKRNPVWVSIISQVTPSESSLIKLVGYEPMFLAHLREHLGIKSVKRVYLHEPLTNIRKLIVLQMEKPLETEVWRALLGTITLHPWVGKIVVAVDSDIDPTNLDAVMWALCYRMRPDKDIQIIGGREKGHAPPFKMAQDLREYQSGEVNDASLLINAIQKEPFPPVALPKMEYMENAKAIWEELGLPPLKPEPPWYGYSLGDWTSEMEDEAELAVRGDHYAIGRKLASMRIKI